MEPQLAVFSRHFTKLHDRSVTLVRSVSNAELFEKPDRVDRPRTMSSGGEYVLRSAAAVEQTCGGITTRLWDDPFEWTLPEKLSTPDLVVGYLQEVEETRRRAFSYFTSDDDLRKQIPAPERIRPIFDLLLETLGRAEHFQGRAFAVFQMLSDVKLPRI